ncbi:MAG: PEP/pyruvate-binding domain-containing protein [Gemmataceae bacterium]
MPQRHVYFFGNGHADAGAELKEIVGGKGASLGEMTRAGLQVPPGFTLSAECCDYYGKHRNQWPDGLDAEVRANLQRLEQLSGRTFGQGDLPLLVAVRSGAAQSMPGMMDTVLNVGLHPACVRVIAQRTGNARGAWEAYLHFQLMFCRTVAGIPDSELGRLESQFRQSCGKSADDSLDAAQIEQLSGKIADLHRKRIGIDFPTDPWALLCAAINAVFGSWNNERAITYRKHHQIEGLLGTAVNVQAMCPSEISGVMFTGNPVNPALEQMIIESSYGLGEAIVLGKVTPDRFVLDKKSLAILERHIANKNTHVAAVVENTHAITGAKDAASLTDQQVTDLAKLGQRVESYFKTPCDIEWAWSQGQFFLLQSRAIKHKGPANIDPAERERVRQEEIAELQKKAAPEGTVWSRFNLSEVLSDPTPMTWSIVDAYMSARGGFGLMYRDLGFSPHPELEHRSTYDLIAGRIYCNLTLLPRMQHGTMPYVHRFDTLKADPRKAIYPTETFDVSKTSLGFWMKLPLMSIKAWWGESKRQTALRTFAGPFEETTVPEFVRSVEAAWKEDWSAISPLELLAMFEDWRQRTLVDFTREALKPTALAAILMAKLQAAFARRFQPPGTKPKEGESPAAERADAAMRALTMGAHPPADIDLPLGLEALRTGAMDRTTFLQKFGHRASHEMDLAQPRWAEQTDMLDSLAKGGGAQAGKAAATFDAEWQRIAKELRLAKFQIPFVERELKNLHKLLGLREAGKHYMLMGYALIRRALVELDRRYKLEGRIFFLTRDELPTLISRPPSDEVHRTAWLDKANARKRRREIALSLMVPQVIFSDDPEAIGRAIEAGGENVFQGTPLSAGIGEAVAWVLDDVAGATPPPESYVLVCPTTDPAWVPLFANARGLVMETGGVLSHGAIVAREFGLPAVAGIADVHRRIRTGQRLQVDGGTGLVRVAEDL